VVVVMRLDDLRRLVADSAPSDWHKIGCYGAGADPSDRRGHRSVFVFREDVNLAMAHGAPIDDGEPWEDAELAPGPRHEVRGVLLDVFWAGALVDRQALHLVDDGRGILPAMVMGPRRRSPPSPAPVRSRPAATEPRITGSTAAGTARSTGPSTPSPLPGCAAAPRPRPTSPAAPVKARPARKSDAASLGKYRAPDLPHPCPPR
jgi:hypothetical protein